MEFGEDLPPRLVRVGDAIVDVQRIAYIAKDGDQYHVHFAGGGQLKVRSEEGKEIVDRWKKEVEPDDDEAEDWRG